MKIAFDVSYRQSGHQYRGIGIYAEKLLLALRQFDQRNHYLEFIAGQSLPAGAVLVHYPAFTLFSRMLRLYPDTKTVVTVHDLIPLRFPNHFPVGWRGRFNWSCQRKQLQRIEAVITDSLASKADLLQFAGLPPEKVTVVYLAAAAVFKPGKNAAFLQGLRQQYDLPLRFFLYVGDINWHKNVPGLLRAFAAVTATDTNLKLVLVGQAFKESDLTENHQLTALIQSLNLTEKIIKVGFIPEADLAGIYNLALALVQPSFYEGYGLPVLEAMQSGCPVIASREASLPEIGGRAPLYVTPEKQTELVAAMVKVLKRGEKDLVTVGLKEAQKFSWQKTALATRAVYEKIL